MVTGLLGSFHLVLQAGTAIKQETGNLRDDSFLVLPEVYSVSAVVRPRALNERGAFLVGHDIVHRLDYLGFRGGVEGHHDGRIERPVVIRYKPLVEPGDRINECTGIFFLGLLAVCREDHPVLVQVVHDEADQHLLGLEHERERHVGFRRSGDAQLEHLYFQLHHLEKAHVLPVIKYKLRPIVLPRLVTIRERSLVLAGDLSTNVVELVGWLLGERVLAIKFKEVDDLGTRNLQVPLVVHPRLLELRREAGHQPNINTELLGPVYHIRSIVREVPAG